MIQENDHPNADPFSDQEAFIGTKSQNTSRQQIFTFEDLYAISLKKRTFSASHELKEKV